MTPHCVRCNAPPAAVMSYDYAAAQIWIEDGVTPSVPGTAYPLCGEHASRLTPPRGWTLTDRRGPARTLFVAVA